MSELLAAEQFIHGTLNTDEALRNLIGTRIHSHVVPPAQAASEAAYPCVVFSAISSTDVRVIAGVRLACNCLYAVKVIGRGNGFAAIATAVDRVDTLLHNQRDATVADGLVLSCVRVQPFSQVEVEDGVRYYSRGGLYRLMIS